MTDKQTYYVSVHEGTALEDVSAADFEFEIRATQGELDRLEQLFQEKDEAENRTFVRGMTPGIPYHQDEPNDTYDEVLLRVYRLIYDLGTSETKQHIEQMNVLNKPQNADSAMPLH